MISNMEFQEEIMVGDTIKLDTNGKEYTFEGFVDCDNGYPSECHSCKGKINLKEDNYIDCMRNIDDHHEIISKEEGTYYLKLTIVRDYIDWEIDNLFEI